MLGRAEEEEPRVTREYSEATDKVAWTPRGEEPAPKDDGKPKYIDELPPVRRLEALLCSVALAMPQAGVTLTSDRLGCRA